MEQTAEVIKKTGIFDRVDRLYGDFDALVSGAGGAEAGAGADDAGGADAGGLGGGADAGGLGGGADAGAGADDAGGAAPTEESTNKKDNLLLETKKRNYEEKVKRYQGIYLKRLTESLEKDENKYNLDSFEKGADNLNSKINEITNQIDNMIN